jgi:diphthine-ammonia ligase
VYVHITLFNVAGEIDDRCSCQRLSLIPLCYLWQRPQDELLTEMIDAGLEAVLIKVAGIGLTAKHLQRTLAELKDHLFSLVRFRCLL